MKANQVFAKLYYFVMGELTLYSVVICVQSDELRVHTYVVRI